MTTSLLAATAQVTALAWVLALVVDRTPLETVPAFLVGVGLLAVSVVATVGMIVVGGRWAQRMGLVTVAFTVALAMIRPIDVFWVIALATTACALAALLSPALSHTIRKLPSAAGPPPRAIAAPLLLLGAPGLLGMVGNDAEPLPLLVVGLSAPIVALLYSRVVPGGLLAIRIVWPVTALALSPLLGLQAGIAAVALAAAVIVISWGRSVKTSYHPPREVGTTFPIPPELAPREVLDAADIDERGQPR